MEHFEQRLDPAGRKELEELKHQLFRENVRLQAETARLAADADAIHRERRELADERRQLQREKRQLSKIQPSDIVKAIFKILPPTP